MSGSDEKTVHVREWNGGSWISTVLRGQFSQVNCVRVSCYRFVSGSVDETICVWDLSGGKWGSTMLDGNTYWVTEVFINEYRRNILKKYSITAFVDYINEYGVWMRQKSEDNGQWEDSWLLIAYEWPLGLSDMFRIWRVLLTAADGHAFWNWKRGHMLFGADILTTCDVKSTIIVLIRVKYMRLV